ncbi:cation channel sperm-associated protein 3 [Mycteria americana]|uniref:cation channel sperm-associated protein 3 n=1 Tax=Mycteria americana TaxID=33587 RepID=UPI003F58E836
MVPAGRGTLSGTFNMKVLAWCMGSGSHRQLPGLASSSLQVTDAFFVAVYTTELLLKLYVDPIAYWKSGYDILGAAILLVAFLPHILPVDTATCTRPEGTTRGLSPSLSPSACSSSSSTAAGCTALWMHARELVQKWSREAVTCHIPSPASQPSSRLSISLTYGARICFFFCRFFTETLGQTVQTVTDALILLFLLMFVFAILGHGWYGDPKTGDIENCGSLKAAVFTLFSLVTVDGWTDLQRGMDHYGFTSSHVFIVVFILLGNFIFFNTLIALVITKTQVMRALCIERACMRERVRACLPLALLQRTPAWSQGQGLLGVLGEYAVSGARGLTRIPVVWHQQDLSQKYGQDCKAAKAAAAWAKKQKILKKQGKNVSNQVMLEQHKITQGEDFSELLDDIKKTLRHSDIIIMEGFCFTIPFIDLYLLFLDRQDDTLNSMPGREARAHPRFMGAVGLEDVFAPKFGRLRHHYYEHTGILRGIVEVMKEKSLPDHEKMKS